VLKAYKDGSIVWALGSFFPIPYSGEFILRQRWGLTNSLLWGKPAFLEDCMGATFFYRSSQSTKLLNRAEVLKLLAPEMCNQSLKKKIFGRRDLTSPM
jgi:hypothetical protein